MLASIHHTAGSVMGYGVSGGLNRYSFFFHIFRIRWRFSLENKTAGHDTCISPNSRMNHQPLQFFLSLDKRSTALPSYRSYGMFQYILISSSLANITSLVVESILLESSYPLVSNMAIEDQSFTDEWFFPATSVH